ncbi:lysyl oxidase-like protein 2/3/4 [Apiospora kogelbergensis]|uniref:lysyl oxidase-like protein 2/3/4 n=1 Tax=Apiospora kogelbergensis TaxID=1337665 RepID=UPI0031306603
MDGGMAHSTEGYLWQAISGASSGLPTEAVTFSTPHLQERYDVVVIGAGFAGLVAARELSANGDLKVLLVEGRDRIGGRTWTAKALGQHFEMGGTWVHWIQPFVYAEIARYGLQRHLKTSSGPLATERLFEPSSGGIVTMAAKEQDASMRRIAQSFFSIDGLSSRELMPYPLDLLREPAPWTKYDHVTARERLDQLEGESQQDREVFEALICTFGGVSGSELAWTEALRWFALAGHDFDRIAEFAGVYKLGGGGMTMLAKSILGDYRGDILMQTTIRTIAQNDDRVILTATNGREIRADRAVCTIPLNALSSIQFDPPLDAVRQEAVQKGHVCNVTKFHIKLASVEPPFYSSANANSCSPYCFAFSDHSSADGTYAIGFGYGGRLNDHKSHDEILAQFEKHMKPGTEARAYLTHDWAADPLSKGSWACWGPGSMSKYLAALQQPHCRVAMASADWANGFRGFVDGAIEQGILAARDVRHSLKTPGSNM